VALANFIPTSWGLGFAGILCLVGILCSLASTRMRVVSAAVAGAAAVAWRTRCRSSSISWWPLRLP
jgi:hypothetical protein